MDSGIGFDIPGEGEGDAGAEMAEGGDPGEEQVLTGDGGAGGGNAADGGQGAADGGSVAGPGVQEGLCERGTTRQCYRHGGSYAGQGACTLGVQVCPEIEFATWGECEGDQAPGAETCDGIDNDCDGEVDEGLGSTTCGVGPCQVTVDNCVDGGSNGCEPADAATDEVCDGLDNDCDGDVDEGLGTGMTVTCGMGQCLHTVEACAPGEELACDPLEGASSEVCDGLDNDCDGVVDNGVLNACGECGPEPVEACDGLDNDCDGSVDEGVQNACGACGAVPSEECDGVDNDCDGSVDEGVQNACGACGVVPAEVCDGVDNDCDGTVDEGCPCDAVTTGSSADAVRRPADILLIVDNSASMKDETAWVQEQVYAFTTDLATQDVDSRLILFTERGTDDRQLCVPEPLAGPNCADNPPGFYHADESISSSLGFHDLVRKPELWRHLLREGADLHIVFISDDDEAWTAQEMLDEYAEEVVPAGPDFTYHAVVAVTDCPDGADIGENHMALATRTGGTIHDLCEQDFSAVFDGLADGIITGSIDCHWALPDAPPGGVLDTSQLSVTYDDGAGAQASLPQRASESACSPDGFYSTAEGVSLCESSCQGIQGNPSARIEVRVGCTLSP